MQTGSKAVDIFNAIAGNWSTAVLSEARGLLAATSLPNQELAIFAGGLGLLCDCYCFYCDDCREALRCEGGVGQGEMHAWEEYDVFSAL